MILFTGIILGNLIKVSKKDSNIVQESEKKSILIKQE